MKKGSFSNFIGSRKYRINKLTIKQLIILHITFSKSHKLEEKEEEKGEKKRNILISKNIQRLA